VSSRDAARRFHFLREIASGGFGSVFLAKVMHADGFSRLVAVKVLKSQWSDNAEVTGRMRDEARLLGLLRHRNIVDVMDMTSIDGRAAVIMEYLEAVDLRTIVLELLRSQERLPVRAALEVGAAVASALDAAYNRPPIPGEKPLRVIHRDIKPSNIMIDETGMVKVLDFGVARSELENRESHTQELQFGSVDYMAPERLFFEPETPASDVYSLGASVFEIMAREPFGKAQGRPEKHAAYVADRLSFLRAGLRISGPAGGELEKLLRSTLAFNHEERPTAAEFHQRSRALARLVDDEDLISWAERIVPPLVAAAARQVLEPNPLVDQVVSEDTQVFMGAGDLPPDPARLGEALREGALAELEDSDVFAANPASGAPLAAPMPAPVDDWDDGPTNAGRGGVKVSRPDFRRDAQRASDKVGSPAGLVAPAAPPVVAIERGGVVPESRRPVEPAGPRDPSAAEPAIAQVAGLPPARPSRPPEPRAAAPSSPSRPSSPPESAREAESATVTVAPTVKSDPRGVALPPLVRTSGELVSAPMEPETPAMLAPDRPGLAVNAPERPSLAAAAAPDRSPASSAASLPDRTSAPPGVALAAPPVAVEAPSLVAPNAGEEPTTQLGSPAANGGPETESLPLAPTYLPALPAPQGENPPDLAAAAAELAARSRRPPTPPSPEVEVAAVRPQANAFGAGIKPGELPAPRAEGPTRLPPPARVSETMRSPPNPTLIPPDREDATLAMEVDPQTGAPLGGEPYFGASDAREPALNRVPTGAPGANGLRIPRTESPSVEDVPTHFGQASPEVAAAVAAYDDLAPQDSTDVGPRPSAMVEDSDDEPATEMPAPHAKSKAAPQKPATQPKKSNRALVIGAVAVLGCGGLLLVGALGVGGWWWWQNQGANSVLPGLTAEERDATAEQILAEGEPEEGTPEQAPADPEAKKAEEPSDPAALADEEEPAAAPSGPVARFRAGQEVRSLEVDCNNGQKAKVKGQESLQISVDGADKCEVKAIGLARERMNARIAPPLEGDWTCFTGESRDCAKD